MPVDETPSKGCFEVADFTGQVMAEHIAKLHNESLSGKLFVVQESLFGDYGNGQIYGITFDADAAGKLAQSLLHEAVTDTIEVERT